MRIRLLLIVVVCTRQAEAVRDLLCISFECISDYDST